MLTQEVKDDIKLLLDESYKHWQVMADENMCDCKEDACCDCDNGVCLTVAVNEEGNEWSYQTGDNSYTGGAYGLPHWAVVWVMPTSYDQDKEELYKDIINQLEDLLVE